MAGAAPQLNGENRPVRQTASDPPRRHIKRCNATTLGDQPVGGSTATTSHDSPIGAATTVIATGARTSTARAQAKTSGP